MRALIRTVVVTIAFLWADESAAASSSKKAEALTEYMEKWYQKIGQRSSMQWINQSVSMDSLHDFYARVLSCRTLEDEEAVIEKPTAYFNVALNRHLIDEGKQVRRARLIQAHNPIAPTALRQTAEEMVIAREDALLREWALALAAKDPAVRLRLDGRSMKEIASQLGTTVGAVKMRIKRVIKKVGRVVRREAEHGASLAVRGLRVGGKVLGSLLLLDRLGLLPDWLSAD